MSSKAMSLKAKIRNIAKANNVAAQVCEWVVNTITFLFIEFNYF
jgi:hypothetical protein